MKSHGLRRRRVGGNAPKRQKAAAGATVLEGSGATGQMGRELIGTIGRNDW